MNIYEKMTLYKENFDDVTRLRIPILNEEGETLGVLFCLDRGMAAIPGFAKILANWRQANMQWFMTQFTATPARTQQWLDTVIIPEPNRIMFMIYTADWDMIGHYGIKSIKTWYAELDNGLRGERRGPKGMMHYAEIALLSWMFGTLGMRVANLWIFSNNEPTLKWHLKNGYKIGKSLPLYKQVRNWGVEYTTDEAEGALADFEYLEMTISKRDLLLMHPWITERYNWTPEKLIEGF